MTTRVERAGLQVASVLADLLEQDVLPGTGVEAGHFWEQFAALLKDGSVRAWGISGWGGSGVPENLANLTTIFGCTWYFSDSSAAYHYPCPRNT